MEKKEKIIQITKNIKETLKNEKFGSRQTPVSFKKDEFITGAMLARENNLDKNDVQSVLLNLYKTRTSINVNSGRKPVTFISGDLRTIYLHPLAKEIFVKYFSNQKD